MTQSQYIKQYKYYALTTSSGGLFPSVKMAQAILESNSGKSELSVLYNNHFGVKSSSDWTGGIADMSTLEYLGASQPSRIVAGFRVYKTAYEGFRDHTRFLLENPRYAKALSQPTAYSQAIELQNAGYATDPNYASKLTSLIEQHELFKLDEKKKTMKNLEIVKSVLLLALAIITIYSTVKSM